MINSNAKIVFVGCKNCADSNAADEPSMGIYVLDLNGIQVKRISSLIPYYESDDGDAFLWSPDAKHFAFMANSERTADSTIKGVGLWVADVETGEVNLVFPLASQEEITDFEWSPDGSRLAISFIPVQVTVSDYQSAIVVINKDGSARNIHSDKYPWGMYYALLSFGTQMETGLLDCVMQRIYIISSLIDGGEPTTIQYS